MAHTLITTTTERLLRSDLERLREKLEVDFATRIRDARSTGDGSSGDDFLQIREEELVLRAEISRIETLLAGAVVVEDQGADEGTAGIGSIVEVRDASGSAHRHVITGDYDRGEVGDGLRAVSASSPVGQALLGRATGDQVEVELPGGRVRSLEVVAVSRPMELTARPAPV
jgi:transcription elongation factor GreA